MHDTSQSPQKGVLAREPFLARVREERARSDRQGTSFAVLAYSVPEPGADLERASMTIASRVRSSDVLGWLEPSVLGVLVLRVGQQDAARLAEGLVAGISVPEAPLECTVYQHPPLTWRPDDGGPQARGNPDRAAGER